MECPKCRREIITVLPPSELVFCPYCGEKLAAYPEDEYSYCPVCGQHIPKGSSYCLHCGKGLKTPPQPCTEQLERHKVPAEKSFAGEPEYKIENVDIPVAGMEYEEQPHEANAECAAEPENARNNFALTIKYWFLRFTEPLRDIISGQWRIRRLYRKWVRDGDLSPEDTPVSQEFIPTPGENTARATSDRFLLLVVLCALAFIAFFVIIGIMMNQC